MKKSSQSQTKTKIFFTFLLGFVILTLAVFRTASSGFTGSEEDAPNAIDLNGQLVTENASNGTLIGQLLATDPDNDSSELVYFLTNNAGGRFSIVGQNQLFYVAVANGNDFIDYETNPFYEITVLVRDPDWNTYDQNFVIIVNNMNEAPTDIVFAASTILDDVEEGAVVGTLQAVDPDLGDTHIFTLLNDAGGRFALINENSIVITEDAVIIAMTYDIAVRVENGVGNTYEKNFGVTVNPTEAPVISALNVTTNNSGITNTVTWETDKGAKSRVEVGLNQTYGTMTSYTDTFTSSQEVELPELQSCATYDFRVRSVDQLGKETMGEESILTTGGCIGGAEVVAQKRKQIIRSEGGNIELQNGGIQGIRVNVPPLFSNESTEAQFQIKSLLAGAAMQVTAKPAEDLYLAGQYLYDLKAITSTTDSILEFDENLSLIFSYSDENIGITDEATLKIYRWNGVQWNKLSRCSNDTLNNTVTCFTNEFSTFGLFGNMNEIAQGLSGKSKTLRRTGMEKSEFRSTSKNEISKVNFSVAYEESLREIDRINQGVRGQIWLADSTKGEKVFGGYKSGRLPTKSLVAEDRVTRVVYRGSGEERMLARKEQQEQQQLVAVDKPTWQENFSGLKERIGKKGTRATQEKQERGFQLAMDDKLGNAKTLLQLYQIASEEMTLCLTNPSEYCDEIYEFLATEIAAKEKEVVDQLMKSNNW